MFEEGKRKAHVGLLSFYTILIYGLIIFVFGWIAGFEGAELLKFILIVIGVAASIVGGIMGIGNGLEWIGKRFGGQK